LSKKYHSKIESIVKLNGVEGTDIKLGQILIIPIFEDENAPKKIDENKYTYYVVQKSEGKWRVSYDHGITVDELERLNPEIVNETIKVNQKLVVPKFITSKEEVLDEEHYIYYTVQPKETMYSLAKRFAITEEEMIALNPVLKDGLKADQTIKLPRNTIPEKPVVDKFVIDKIDVGERNDFPITKIDSLKVVPQQQYNLLDSLQLDKTYKIAILLPFKIKAIKEAGEDNCKLLSNSSVLSYYTGIQMAIDSLKQLGMQIQYDVFDTQASPFVVGRILEVTDLSDYNFVIGPIKKENIEKVAEVLELDNTPVVVHNYKGDKKFRNLIVTTTNNADVEKHLIQYLREKSVGKAINIICDPNNRVKADTIAKQLGGKVTIMEGKETKKGNSIAATTIMSKLSKDKDNFVLMITSDDSFAFSVLSTLNSVAEKRKVTLFTLKDEKLYEDDTNDRMNVFLAKLHYHFPTKIVRLFDKKVAAKYKQKYKTLPSFAAINGFDTTFDIFVRAANADNLFEGLQKIGRTTQSSKVYLYKHNAEDGFKNQGSIILNINKNLELIKVE
jgi:LysM repeat protein